MNAPESLSESSSETPPVLSGEISPDSRPDTPESPSTPRAIDNSAAPTAVRAPGIKRGDAFYSRVFALGVTIALAAVLYVILRPFIGPLIWAMFLAFLLFPIHLRLTRYLKGREQLSASLLIVATFILLVGPLTAMSTAFAAQATDLVQWAQQTLAKQTQEKFHPFADVPLVGPAVQWLRETFGIRSGDIHRWMIQGAKVLPTFFADLGGRLFLGALNTVFGFVIMLFVLYFFIRDGRKIVTMMRDLVPMSARHREPLMDHIAAVTRAVVFGTGITALVQGALVSLAFLFSGLSSPLVFGVVAAILALLPFGGTAFVWIPAVFFLASGDQWGSMTIMLVMGILSSSADNILRPLLISGRAEVGALTVFIGVLGGTAAFGPVGLFLGPVALALILALLDFTRQLRLAR